MATEYHLITQNGTSGSYWTNLVATGGAGDPYGNTPDRYSDGSGGYLVFSSFSNWKSGIAARRDPKKVLICEVEGAWTDTTSAYIDVLTGFYSVKITTKINGVWGSGFHYGSLTTGFKWQASQAVIRTDSFGSVIEGLHIVSTGSYSAIVPIGTRTTVCNCMIKATVNGISNSGTAHIIEHNLFYLCGTGVYLTSYNSSFLCANNTIVGCTTGLSCGTNTNASIVNNICYGNTTNWGTAPSSGYWGNNAGQSDGGGGYTGGTPWTTSGATAVALTSADFKDYSGGDYSPSGDSSAHTSSSLLVDVASQEFADMIAIDIAGNPRPSYKNGDSTNWDIGAYEFDWGYGLAPASCTLTISAPTSLVGAEVRIYDYDNNPAGSFGTELAGIESCTTSTYTYIGLANNTIYIQIMLDGWVEFGQTLTLTEGNLAFYALMQADPNI